MEKEPRNAYKEANLHKNGRAHNLCKELSSVLANYGLEMLGLIADDTHNPRGDYDIVVIINTVDYYNDLPKLPKSVTG